jgi:hypothetical protein
MVRGKYNVVVFNQEPRREDVKGSKVIGPLIIKSALDDE